MITEIQGLINDEINAIKNIPVGEEIEQAIEKIHKAVHEENGKVIISGMGKAGQIGANIASTLSGTGTPAVFLHPAEAQHGDLGLIQQNDVMLLISNSGKTREVLELVTLARNLHPDLFIITLTGHPENALSKASQISISTGNPTEICPLNLTPTTSTTVMTVIGDILVVQMMKKIGFTAQDFASRHHSGYLGQKSRQS